jgi:hypothetical protein
MSQLTNLKVPELPAALDADRRVSDILRSCFQPDPVRRPTVAELVDSLKHLVDHGACCMRYK